MTRKGQNSESRLSLLLLLLVSTAVHRVYFWYIVISKFVVQLYRARYKDYNFVLGGILRVPTCIGASLNQKANK